MKKLVLFFAFFGALSLGVAQAQSCCQSKSAGKTAASCSSTSEAAAKAASMDASIEKRVCEKSGTVSYVRKVSNGGYEDVNYDAASGKFVNVAPQANTTTAPKAACSPAGAASCGSGAKTTAGGGACCSQKAPAMKTSTSAVKTSATSTGGQK